MSVNQSLGTHTHTHAVRWTFASLVVRLLLPLLWLWGLKWSSVTQETESRNAEEQIKARSHRLFSFLLYLKGKNSSCPLITRPCLGLRLSGMDLVVPVFHLVGQFWLSEYKTSFLSWWNNASMTSPCALRVLRKYFSPHCSYITIRRTEFTSCPNEQSPARWNEKLLLNKC